MGYAKVCVIPKCPNKSAVRIADTNNEYRRDLCKEHGIVTLRHYGDKVEIVDTWNGTTMEDYEND